MKGREAKPEPVGQASGRLCCYPVAAAGGVSKHPKEEAKQAGVSRFCRKLSLEVFEGLTNFQVKPVKKQEAKPERVISASGRSCY
eukprot:COSAG02_NODE_725_length_18021_cov_392.218279_7_plen_85_part_00